ncbi:Ger(x)C family spore germination protein [Lysinibacillus cavernae]|uniref:Ger(x)C family spore germination protein n=1 Tax=Lysinibacillus cavernae TaxID=2666135 RepID=UPI0012D86E0B|nr:Ger(x)C family spore germination protein [Lysinibacillus cavernae]
MRKKRLCIISFFVLVLLVGCSRKELKVPLEDVGMVDSMAFDYIDENQMKLTVAIPQYSPEAKKNTQIFSITTDLVSSGIVEIEKQSDKKIVFNQLRVVLVNEDFARKGDIRKIIQHLYRNAEVGNKVLIAVVKDNAEAILKADYPDKPSINFYLNNLLEPSINTAFNPNTNIHDFMYTITNPVFDTVLPFIEKRGEKLEVNGVAVFKGNRMHELIKPEEALVIQALSGRKNLAPLHLDLNAGHGEEKLMIDLIESTVKKVSNKNIESPKLTIFLKIKGTLSEYKGERESQLITTESISELEKDVNKQLEKNIGEFLERLNNMEVDPAGLSEEFRMYYYGEWTTEKTRDLIRKLDIKLHVETSIISTGTLK